MNKQIIKFFLIAIGIFTFYVTANASESTIEIDRYQMINEGSDGRMWANLTFQYPANRGTWATPSLQSRSGTKIVNPMQPAHAVQSRIISGTNATPGAASAFLDHTAGMLSNRRIHTLPVGRGQSIRVQLRATASRSTSFTSTGSWSP